MIDLDVAMRKLVADYGLSNVISAVADCADSCIHMDIKDGGDGKGYQAICNALKQLAQDALNA